jgi:amino acid adenylation domain-containing protein
MMPLAIYNDRHSTSPSAPTVGKGDLSLVQRDASNRVRRHSPHDVRPQRATSSPAHSLITKLRANFQPVTEKIKILGDTQPTSVALRDGDRELSYEELDDAADRLAGYLAQCGVIAGGTVAICMERSFDWIVAALGIMRAGAAYVPLDSAWPDARLQFAVADSGASILVARAELLGRLHVQARGIDPGRDARAIAAAPCAAQPPVTPDSLAYVIYTSGSTGVPKGVEITHANLGHLIRWHLDAFDVTRRDRASHLAGLGFDAAVWEIWPHLAAGATLCLADDAVRSSPDLLREWMIRERVTIAFVPTVHAMPLIATPWPSTTALRFLLTGGDVLHRGPAAGLPFEVVNNYGPTEGTVLATSTVLKPGSASVPPIGCAITGARVYLLDEQGEPVPDGSCGEIYIGGAGVGRGYRNRPDLTERAFLTDPFVPAPDARMYRTGDRGVRRADGAIEFRGRGDRQTKIRGQRVELDEIGSILSQHPSVDFAVAVARPSPAGETEIIVHVLLKRDAGVPTAPDLREHLGRSLPAFMMPAAFVRLDALPVSPNGKLDLTRLPQPTEGNQFEGRAAESSASPIERKLLTMVQEILKSDSVAPDDNFFLAGGHSLLGMQLVMCLRRTFGVDLSLRQLFEAPTAKHLAVMVEAMLGESGLAESPSVHERADRVPGRGTDKSVLPDGVIALQPRGTRDNIFWIHSHLSIGLAKVIGDDQPFLSVLLTPQDFSFLRDAPSLQNFATCLVRKIQAVQPEGPYTLGGFCLGGLLAYEIASQLRTAGHPVSFVAIADAPNPSCIPSCDSLTSKVKYLRYLLKRATRIRPRQSFLYLCQGLRERFARGQKSKSAENEILQAAGLSYRPPRYDGKVLLILASERPPHVNYLPGWQTIVRENLHTQYVEGHHRDFPKETVLRGVADAILHHHASATQAQKEQDPSRHILEPAGAVEELVLTRSYA